MPNDAAVVQSYKEAMDKRRHNEAQSLSTLEALRERNERRAHEVEGLLSIGRSSERAHR